jgi:sulfite reductase beta subunit-like hemoprotein
MRHGYPVTNAGVHEFLPTSEIFRVAQAILRVFQRLGDYKHKQRNRMKFMIRELGWTRWLEEYERELTRCRLSGEVPTLDIAPPAVEPKPDWTKEASPAVGQIASRVAAQKVTGPGIAPTIVPLLQVGDEAYARWRATNVRSQKQFGYHIVTVTVPLGDLSSAQMRVIGELSRAYSDGSVRVSADQNLLFRWVNTRRAAVIAVWRPPDWALLRPAPSRTWPVAPARESCRLAVTQSRTWPNARGPSAASDLIAAAKASTSRSAGARTVAASITSRQSARAAFAGLTGARCRSTRVGRRRRGRDWRSVCRSGVGARAADAGG